MDKREWLRKELMKKKGVDPRYVEFYLDELPKDFRGLTNEDVDAYYEEFDEWYASMKKMDEDRERFESLPEEVKNRIKRDDEEYDAISKSFEKSGTICYDYNDPYEMEKHFKENYLM